jgi:hypothetical protein
MGCSHDWHVDYYAEDKGRKYTVYYCSLCPETKTEPGWKDS